jgi:hypothetical protein
MATEHEVARSIKALEPLISTMCQLGCAPSLSVGVHHLGKEIYSNHFGLRDVQTGERSDGNTTYFIGSMTNGGGIDRNLCRKRLAGMDDASMSHSPSIGWEVGWKRILHDSF